MKKSKTKIFIICMATVLTAGVLFSGTNLLSQFKGVWEIMNRRSVNIGDSYVAFSVFKGSRIGEICFARKVIPQKGRIRIDCNAKPSSADIENAKKTLGNDWDSGDKKTFKSGTIYLYKTKDGIKFDPKGRDYIKME